MESTGVCWMEDLGQSPRYPQCPPFPDRGGRSLLIGKREYLGTCLMWGLAGKENIWDLLGVGFGEALMQGCFDVYITGEFASF